MSPVWLIDAPLKRLLAWVGLAVCALVALALWGMWQLGEHHGRTTAQAECKADAFKKRAERAEKAIQTYEAHVRAGEQATAALLADLAAQREVNTTLKARLANVPKFFTTPACPDPGAARLTAGSVRQLNTGLGYPQLPSGACGPDGTPASACAADSGISTEDLRQNAQRNYEACAAIRTHCQALIDETQRRYAADAGDYDGTQ